MLEKVHESRHEARGERDQHRIGYDRQLPYGVQNPVPNTNRLNPNPKK